MSEKFPNENEESVDQSRRGFLKGIGSLGALGAIGGAIYLKEESKEQLEEFEKGAEPYRVPVENMERKDDVMEEIVHNKGRITRLTALKREGFATEIDAPQNVDIVYFLKRYPGYPTERPSIEDIETEINVLTKRIQELEEARDKFPQ